MTNKDVSFDEFLQICGEVVELCSDYVLKSLNKAKDRNISDEMLRNFMILIMMQPIFSFEESCKDGFETYRQYLLLVIQTLGKDADSTTPFLKETLNRSFKNDSDAVNEYLAKLNKLK